MTTPIGEVMPTIRARIERMRAEAPTDPDDVSVDRVTMLRERATTQCDNGFPARYRNAVADHPAVVAWAETFVAGARDLPGLLLLGGVGRGKTHQAYGALRRATQALRPHPGVGFRGISWNAHTFADLMATLRPRTGVDTEAELDRYRKLDLLLIDDLAAGKASEWVEEVTYRIVNGRYEDMRPTIYTSNLPLDQLRDSIGDRIASRLAETCTRVVLDGPDRRRTS